MSAPENNRDDRTVTWIWSGGVAFILGTLVFFFSALFDQLFSQPVIGGAIGGSLFLLALGITMLHGSRKR